MAEFINTIDVLGEEATIDGLIDGTLVEFYDNELTEAGGNCFSDSNLQRVILPSVTKVNSHAFSRMYNLMWLEFSCNVTFPTYSLYTMPKLKTFILRSELLCALQGMVAMNAIMYIYVPKALIEEYKVATNWTTFANQFRALEDYTVDGTISGELDESKI